MLLQVSDAGFDTARTVGAHESEGSATAWRRHLHLQRRDSAPVKPCCVSSRVSSKLVRRVVYVLLASEHQVEQPPDIFESKETPKDIQ